MLAACCLACTCPISKSFHIEARLRRTLKYPSARHFGVEVTAFRYRNSQAKSNCPVPAHKSTMYIEFFRFYSVSQVQAKWRNAG